MTRPALISEEIKNSEPVLIVDKDGFLGPSIAAKLSSVTQVVCVSPSGNVYYKGKIPKIPDLPYSKIIFIESISGDKTLPSFVKKAKKEGIGLAYVISLFRAKEQKLKKIEENYHRAVIVVYGDIFSESGAPLEAPVGRLISEVGKGIINLDNDGTDKVYPVFIDDVAAAIIDASFGKHGGAKRFFAFLQSSPTQLSFARMLGRINPDLRIDFNKRKSHPLKIELKGIHLLDNNYPLYEKLKKLKFANLKKVRRSSDGKFWNRLVLPVLFFLFAAIVLPLALSLGTSLLGLWQIKAFEKNLGKGKMESAETNLFLSEKFFRASQITFVPIALEASLLGRGEDAEVFIGKAKLGEETSISFRNLIVGYRLFGGVLQNKAKNPEEDFSKAITHTREGLIGIEKIKAEDILDKDQKERLSKFAPFLDGLSSSIDLFPQIFGIEGERNYLILFQNNMELRPSGGFIGSYGILSLEKGHIKNFTIHDVYDADGQLKAHVEPPYPIRRFLPSPHWYLRDSNFSVDFRNSASSAAYFLNLEKKENVDGVIGIDTSFVRELISSVGSVYVPEYKETINKENFLRVTQARAEEDFFAGSTQKKDFLASLFRALKAEFMNRKDISYLRIGEAFISGINKKHVLVSFGDPRIQQTFTLNGWSSALFDNRPEKEDTINDFFGLNEANLGVSKVNQFIERKISLNVHLNENGEVLETARISFENSGDMDYKNYLRLILPRDTEITSILINGNNQSMVNAVVNPEEYERKDFVPPQELEVEHTQEEGKSLIGFLLMVPPRKETVVSVSYKLSKKLSYNSPSTFYSIKFFKQPGVDEIPFSFSFSYPQRLMQAVDGKLIFEENLSEDKELNIHLSKK